ncbi:hypothetical protein QAD02_016904 [Eretmocerus hayati]|uniref:Uncharacterized protein n=1 Tax=Eretmocerus hayati TaxID=131215 RepID=A0ACC2PF92_9HYME|nr:hypothetical protein QAD02_016904 [Eretmocerus hayati]
MQKLAALIIALNATADLRDRHSSSEGRMNRTFSVIAISNNSTILPDATIGNFDENKIEERFDLRKRELHVSTKHLPGIFKPINGDPQRRGIIGDVWVALGELLNFTMIVTSIAGIPKEFDDCTYSRGWNTSEICMIKSAMGIRSSLLKRVDFTQCYFTSGVKLFIKPDHRFKISWMIDIFSPGLWLCIALFYSFLIILSTFIFLVDPRNNEIQSRPLVMDTFATIFVTLCDQVADLEESKKHRRLLVLSMSLFSWMMLTAHSSLLYIFMSRSDLIAPFHDLESLYQDTDYQVLLADETAATRIFQNGAFKEREKPVIEKLVNSNRVQWYNNSQNMWREACLSKYQSAAFHMAYQYATNYDHHLPCDLLPTGTSYNKLCIAAQIPKKFTFKKPINYGIVKLHEVGIINAIQRRWLNHETSFGVRPYSSIELGHVYLPILVFVSGSTLSLVIFGVENMLQRGKNQT